MLPEQLFRQIKYTAKNLDWPNSSTPIFGANGVLISSGGFPEEQISRLPKPCLILNDGGGTCHPQNPLLLDQIIEALVFVDNVGDVYGEGAYLGGNRASFTTSAGAGLVQIESEILQTFAQRGRVGGVEIVLVAKTATRPLLIANNPPLLYRGYTWEARIGAYGRYNLPPVRSFTASGSVDLAWTLPIGAANRFDWIGTMVRRKTGSAPADETEGTLVYEGTGTTYTDSPGSGTWYYSAFAEYDEDEDTNIDNYSAPVSDDVTV